MWSRWNPAFAGNYTATGKEIESTQRMPDISSGLQSASWQSSAQSGQLKQLQNQLAGSPDGDRKKLKKAAQEFESVFVHQLLDAMDKTVSRENSIMGGGSSEEYWRGMMNEEVAKSMTSRPGGSGFGLSDAIYRQMSEHLKPETSESTASVTQLNQPATNTTFKPMPLNQADLFSKSQINQAALNPGLNSSGAASQAGRF
jgi:Rod binding domain-containing protein